MGTDLILAGPGDTLAALARDLARPEFVSTVLFTLVRVAGGFAMAFALALALGAAASASALVRDLLEPALTAMKSVPVACVVVLLLIWIGSRNVSLVAVVLVALPALYFSVLEALAARDRALSGLLATTRVAPWRRVLACTWPDVVPFLLASGRNCVGMSWKAGVAAELIGIPQGSVGERVYQAKLLFETADLFAWTIVVVALAWACERLFLRALAASREAALALAARPRRDAGGLGTSGLGAAAIGLSRVVVDFGAVRVGSASLELAPGGRAVMTDESGAGKSTMLEVVLGRLVPASGEVRAPARPCVMLQRTLLVEDLDAQGNVVLGCDGRLSRDVARDLLLEVLPPEALSRPVRELSGGMRRRVELVRALAERGDAVVLDEPLASLDAAARRRACAFICDRLGGRTLLVASHDAGTAELLGARELRVIER